MKQNEPGVCSTSTGSAVQIWYKALELIRPCVFNIGHVPRICFTDSKLIQNEAILNRGDEETEIKCL